MCFIKFSNIHRVAPITVGMSTDIAVYRKFPISFFIVSNVVVQGQWNSENKITLRQVKESQPLAKNTAFISSLPTPFILLAPRYIITAMGRTISFAGEPNIKARRITASIHNSLPSGSRNEAK